MTISLHLEAANVSELQRMCAELAHSGAPVEAIVAVTTQTVADPLAKARAAKAAKNSKSTEAPPSAVADIVEKPAEAAVVSPPATASADALPSVSIDDVREKCRELSSAKGLPAVTAILHTFKIFKDGKFIDKKVERMSDLGPSDYAAVIAKVDAAIK